MEKEPVFITIPEFAIRISVSRQKARQIAQSSVLCDKGISVSINEGERGGVRIHWEKYLEHVSNIPAVAESKRIRGQREQAV